MDLLIKSIVKRPEHWHYTPWKSNMKVSRKLSEAGSFVIRSPAFSPFVEIFDHFQLTRNLILSSAVQTRERKKKTHKHPALPSLNFAKLHLTLHVMFSHPQFDHITDIPIMIWKYWECSVFKPPRTTCFYVEAQGNEAIQALLAA